MIVDHMDILTYAVPALVIVMVAVIGWLAAQLSGKNRHEKQLSDRLESLEKTVSDRYADEKNRTEEDARRDREALSGNLRGMTESMTRAMNDMARSQQGQMKELEERLNRYEAHMDRLGRSVDENGSRVDEMRTGLAERLDRMEQSGEQRYAALGSDMRDSLGASFRNVSDRLDEVCDSMREIGRAAGGIGDLKQMLTGASVGSSSERAELRAVLLGTLPPEKVIMPYEGHSTAAAVRMPGRGASPTLLPVESAFDRDVWDAFMMTERTGTAEERARTGLLLEQAADVGAARAAALIGEGTADFAVLFLPEEAMYAEIMKRGDMASHIREKYRVLITGPSTLTALLNSLQIGYQSVELEQRTAETWQLMRAMKEEFYSFADSLGKTQKRIRQASESLEDAARRSKTLQKRLKKMELPGETEALPDDGQYDGGDWD